MLKYIYLFYVYTTVACKGSSISTIDDRLMRFNFNFVCPIPDPSNKSVL